MSNGQNSAPGRLLRPSGLDMPAASGRTPRIDPLLGQTIDNRYLVERSIGVGATGVVYAALHRVIGKRVAIKVLRSEMAEDPELLARFLQEARSISAIGNAHIVTSNDFGRLPDGSTYFVMELLEGRGLGQLIAEARGPLPVPRVLHIAKQIAAGMGAAHAANIVHRDLKPDNVMLVHHDQDPDFVKILDFGIAKVGDAGKMTRAGSVFGTPHYMSPEQGAGLPVDLRTDVYALGIVLYEMSCGRVPFHAPNLVGILRQHQSSDPVPLRTLPGVNVPPGLDAIVLKCLAKKREARYGSMNELAMDLDRVARGLFVGAGSVAVGAMPPASQHGAPPPVRRSWIPFAVLGLFVTLVAVAALGLIVRGQWVGRLRPALSSPTATASAHP